jgi:urease accessory protein
MMGADVLALGLPAAGDHFDAGVVEQHLELPGRWLDLARIDGSDRLLRESPVGLAGHGVIGTLWLADGSPIARARREALLEAARAHIDALDTPNAPGAMSHAAMDGAASADAIAGAGPTQGDAAAAGVDRWLDTCTAGVTGLDDGLLVLRVLGHRVEPVMRLLHTVWADWRQVHWQRPPCPPRLWKL